MMSIPMAQTQVVANKAKEYSMNKPMPFTGNWTKIRWFLQDCLGYLDMNQGIYNSDQLKIGLILSYMNDGEAANWKEYYLDTLEDPNTGMPNFPTLVTFLADVWKSFSSHWSSTRCGKQTGNAQTGKEDCGRTQYGVLANCWTGGNR
jgi:hypothetical protein